MRIGLVIDRLDPRRGGAERWTCQHAERLLARGHEVHVVTQEVLGGAEQLPIVIHSLGIIRSRLGRAHAAERRLRFLGLDVIHDMGTGWYNDVLQSEDGSRLAQWDEKLKLLPAWMRPIKRGMIRMLPRYRDFRTLMERQFNDPHRIHVAISKGVARHYEDYHRIRPEQIRLVYHGVDAQRFSPAGCQPLRQPTRQRLGLGDGETVFLFAGHDFARKGLATVLRAVGRLVRRRANVRLLVVGGREYDDYLRLAERVGAGHAVVFLGGKKDPLPYFAAADALVLPSYYDPFGLVVLEAAGCELPVIVSRATGASELLSEGADSLLVSDPADDAELASQMERLLDRDLRRRMGAAGRQLALAHTADRNCDETVAIYREVVMGRRRAAA